VLYALLAVVVYQIFLFFFLVINLYLEKVIIRKAKNVKILSFVFASGSFSPKGAPTLSEDPIASIAPIINLPFKSSKNPPLPIAVKNPCKKPVKGKLKKNPKIDDKINSVLFFSIKNLSITANGFVYEK